MPSSRLAGRSASPGPAEARSEEVAYLAALADLTDDTDRAKGACRDPADDTVLSAAIEGRAGVIVTVTVTCWREGHEGMAMVTPRAFLDLVRG